MRWAAAVGGLVALACSGATDLPKGWKSAKPIRDFTQTECSGSDGDSGGTGDDVGEADTRMELTPGPRSLRIDWLEVGFRCAQEVEGFVKHGESTIDMLIQPVDLTPDAVAGCSCIYDLTMQLHDLTPGDYEVSIYERSDHYGGSYGTPALQESGDVTIPDG